MKSALPAALCLHFLITACAGPDGTQGTGSDAPADAPAALQSEKVSPAFPVLVIREHHIDDIPMSHAHHEAVREGRGTDDIDHGKPYLSVRHADLGAALEARAMTSREPRLVTTPAPMPLIVSGTRSEIDHSMLIAYEKNGVEVLSVTTNPEDPEQVEHVVFMHKDHMDQYDVHPGMKGHEARKLRRELKHMSHKGQVFLYEEDSNIVYRLKVLDPNKDTYSEVEVDELEIEAIIWHNRHHHRSKQGADKA